jgi:HEAT repeat protein
MPVFGLAVEEDPMVIPKAYLAAMISIAGFASLVSSQEVLDSPALFRQLQSVGTSDKAKEALMKLASTDPEARKYLAAIIPILIQNSKGHVWLNAVHIAGELKISEAVPALAKWIDVDNVGEISWGLLRNLETNPAGKALAQIGDPSVPALVSILEHGTVSERHTAYLALGLIHSVALRAAIRDHLVHENADFQKVIDVQRGEVTF